MIINIHGFKSSGDGLKFDKLKELFPPPIFEETEVISPDLPVSPKEAIQLLNSLITEGSVVIGTSLGGFYAAVLAATNRSVQKAMIINPVVDPANKMKGHLGVQCNYKTNDEFVWTDTHLDELQILSDIMSNEKPDWLHHDFVVGTHDEKTDMAQVMEWYGTNRVTAYPDEHRFVEYFEEAVRHHLL